MTIPEDWEGAKEVEVRVTAAYGAIVLAAQGLQAQAGDSSIEYLPDQRVSSVLHLPDGDLMQLDAVRETEMTRADVRVVSKQSGGGKKDSGGSKTSGKGKTSSSRRSLPQTGDPASGYETAVALEVAGGLAGIAAGAMLRQQEGEE